MGWNVCDYLRYSYFSIITAHSEFKECKEMKRCEETGKKPLSGDQYNWETLPFLFRSTATYRYKQAYSYFWTHVNLMYISNQLS